MRRPCRCTRPMWSGGETAPQRGHPLAGGSSAARRARGRPPRPGLGPAQLRQEPLEPPRVPHRAHEQRPAALGTGLPQAPWRTWWRWARSTTIASRRVTTPSTPIRLSNALPAGAFRASVPVQTVGRLRDPNPSCRHSYWDPRLPTFRVPLAARVGRIRRAAQRGVSQAELRQTRGPLVFREVRNQQTQSAGGLRTQPPTSSAIRGGSTGYGPFTAGALSEGGYRVGAAA